MTIPRKFLFGICTLIALQLSGVNSRADDDASNLISNPGLEQGAAGYYLNVAGDSKGVKCTLTIDKTTFHSGTQAALIQAADFARCGLGVQAPLHPLTAGEHYRVGVWIKAGPDFQAQPGTPGVALRLDPATGYPPTPVEPLLFINLDQTVTSGFTPPTPMKPVPTDWTHLEAVIEIPAGVDSMGMILFMWKAKGSLYVDDLTFDKVDPSVPATPVVPGPATP